MTRALPGYLGAAPLAPAFERALADGSPAAWDALCEEVGPRVWSFPLLRAAACERLLREIDRRGAESPSRPPNSMHAYGVSLGAIGLEELLVALRVHHLAPLAARHFADVGGDTLDGQHGFLAEYGPTTDESLGYHVDDSAVTLNLCLGGEFNGSELYFRGLRCDEHRQTPATPDEDFEHEHAVGTAILHAGRHRHGVHPIRRGRRRNLILWLQSSVAKAAARQCRPWCGRHAPLRGSRTDLGGAGDRNPSDAP